MRKLMGIFLALCLLPFPALADMQILWENDATTLGGEVAFEIAGAEGSAFVYTVSRNGKELFTTEAVPQSSGAYRPRQEGEYTLQVTAGNETAVSPFRVTSLPLCTLSCSRETVQAGDSITFQAQVQGGVAPFAYEFAVISGTACIARQENTENTLAYAFGYPGEAQVQVLVTDAQGNTAAASVSVTVEEGPGLGISGSTGAFYAQGGMKTWTVSAPGVWTAATDADFIHLHPACGESGDEMTLRLDPGTGSLRTGTVTLSCGDLTADFKVTQSAGNGVEEEVSLDQAWDYLAVEGERIFTWQDARGEATFSVGATGPWTAEGEGDFFTFRQEENSLTVTVQETAAPEMQSGVITLSCGNARAYLYLFRYPALQGADVLDVYLDRTRGTAYEDVLAAEIMTSADAQSLTVSCAAWSEPVILARDQARLVEDSLWWLFDIPLQGHGSQTLLFTARNEAGARQKAAAGIRVEPEPAAFAGESAALTQTDGEYLLSVKTTAAAHKIEILDASGALIRACRAEDARIDRCLPGEEAGRYALWTVALPKDARPAQVRMGEASLAVTETPAAPAEFVRYSQCDGWWKDKKYRHSNLEHSGCAIFALSHALQLLGYTGDEILPENLARTYAFCLLEGGTMNSKLIGHAGDDFGFKTRHELYHNLSDILSRMERGALYSFGVVSGHIAMIAGVTEDESKFRIIDSAPSATFERLKNASMYYRDADGDFVAVSHLDEIPGSTYYIETNAYGGMEYYLDAAYVAKRGVRLILPETE